MTRHSYRRRHDHETEEAGDEFNRLARSRTPPPEAPSRAPATRISAANTQADVLTTSAFDRLERMLESVAAHYSSLERSGRSALPAEAEQVRSVVEVMAALRIVLAQRTTRNAIVERAGPGSSLRAQFETLARMDGTDLARVTPALTQLAMSLKRTLPANDIAPLSEAMDKVMGVAVQQVISEHSVAKRARGSRSPVVLRTMRRAGRAW